MIIWYFIAVEQQQKLLQWNGMEDVLKAYDECEQVLEKAKAFNI